jgi:hypothetical protein
MEFSDTLSDQGRKTTEKFTPKTQTQGTIKPRMICHRVGDSEQMTAYQYYEFQAAERRLSKKEMQEKGL